MCIRDSYGSAEAAEASGGATRTWVFKTDADGFAYYSDEYKASGDALYPVSYTHLDVYKRQTRYCASSPSPRRATSRCATSAT